MLQSAWVMRSNIRLGPFLRSVVQRHNRALPAAAPEHLSRAGGHTEQSSLLRGAPSRRLQLLLQFECIPRCFTKGCVVDNAPWFGAGLEGASELRRERAQRARVVARVVDLRGTMQTPVGNARPTTWNTSTWQNCRIRRDPSNAELAELPIHAVVEPAGMPRLADHLSLKASAKVRKEEFDSRSVVSERRRQLHQDRAKPIV